MTVAVDLGEKRAIGRAKMSSLDEVQRPERVVCASKEKV